MNKWQNILKAQETITDVGFDYDLPEEVKPEEDKCCEEAKEAFIAAFGLPKNLYAPFWGFSTYVREESCKRFKHELMLIQGHKRDPNRPKVIKILNDWEVCDWERHGHERPANFGGWMWDNE